MQIFNENYDGGHALYEPLVVAILGISAALMLLTAGRVQRRKWMATSILLATGAQTIALFTSYFGGYEAPYHRGSGASVGLIGAAVLVVAGALAACKPFRADAAA